VTELQKVERYYPFTKGGLVRVLRVDGLAYAGQLVTFQGFIERCSCVWAVINLLNADGSAGDEYWIKPHNLVAA
jgi:hypothetical protein